MNTENKKDKKGEGKRKMDIENKKKTKKENEEINGYRK